MKTYIKQNDQDYKIEVYYTKGGPNYAYGGEIARGYYISVCPVTLKEENGYTTETYIGFSGVKYKLFEVARKSNSAEAKANEMANEELIQSLIERCSVRT